MQAQPCGRRGQVYDEFLDLGPYTYYLLCLLDVPASPALDLLRQWLVASNNAS